MDQKWLGLGQINAWASSIFQQNENGFCEARPVDSEEHPMGTHLLEYVEPKVHHLILEKTWKKIIVVGRYARMPPYVISKNEKTSKRFKWHRPTAREIDENTLEIACFPGRFYVEHNGLLIATYLKLIGRQSQIKYAERPDCQQSYKLFESCLQDLEDVDTVIVGYVDQLSELASGTGSKGIVKTVCSAGSSFGHQMGVKSYSWVVWSAFGVTYQYN